MSDNGKSRTISLRISKQDEQYLDEIKEKYAKEGEDKSQTDIIIESIKFNHSVLSQDSNYIVQEVTPRQKILIDKIKEMYENIYGKSSKSIVIDDLLTRGLSELEKSLFEYLTSKEKKE